MTSSRPDKKFSRKIAWQGRLDGIFRLTMTFSGLIVILIIAGIFYELVDQSRPALSAFGWKFLVSEEWNPVTRRFGALGSVYGTILSTVIALFFAVPLSLGIAVFLVELAPPWLSKPIGTAIELLAAIPSIIYGMWGLFVFSPFMADHVQPWLSDHFGFLPFFRGAPMGIGMLSAGLILALMILPYVSSVARDVFRLVPTVMKESAYGIGATTWEVTRKVTIPYGMQGLIGACFLGLGRALGETMAVTFVIGNSHGISASLFDAGSSIASTLANEFSEASEPLYLSALMELGLVLCCITFAVQAVSQMWLKSVQKKMGRGL
jgi:phosphate transport system permease protein